MSGAIQLSRALAIDGWMAPDELEFLAKTASNSKKVVEFGSYKGRSTRALCDNCPGIVFAVDPWNGPYITHTGGVLFDQAAQWQEFLRNIEGVNNLAIFRGYSDQFYRANCDTDFDFVFIDGDHRYESVIRDCEIGWDLLKDGGILAGHDYTHHDWPGVKQAVDELFPNRELVNSIWWIRKY